MLIYNVYVEDFNNKSIKTINIFKHASFYDSLLRIKREQKDNFEKFSEEVKKSLMYNFWSKSQYEVVITSWPPYVDDKAINKVVTERDEHIKKGNNFYRNTIQLEVAEKIDIYDQVMLNWDIFIKYLWDNKNLIKKRK